MASTRLNELGFRADVIEAQLAHKEAGYRASCLQSRGIHGRTSAAYAEMGQLFTDLPNFTKQYLAKAATLHAAWNYSSSKSKNVRGVQWRRGQWNF